MRNVRQKYPWTARTYPEFFFMRAKEARKAIRKGADWYMVRLQESDSDRREVELNQLDANPSIGVTGQKRDELMNML